MRGRDQTVSSKNTHLALAVRIIVIVVQSSPSLSLSRFVNLLDTHQYNEYNKRGPLSPMPCYTMCSTKIQNRYSVRMGHYSHSLSLSLSLSHTHTHTHTHTHRYVKQCGSFLTEGRVSYSVFALECLPTLFQLAKDKVPNIRIAVAKLLKETVLNIGNGVCLLCTGGGW